MSVADSSTTFSQNTCQNGRTAKSMRCGRGLAGEARNYTTFTQRRIGIGCFKIKPSIQPGLHAWFGDTRSSEASETAWSKGLRRCVPCWLSRTPATSPDQISPSSPGRQAERSGTAAIAAAYSTLWDRARAVKMATTQLNISPSLLSSAVAFLDL